MTDAARPEGPVVRSLALAMVSSAPAPLLLLDEKLVVVAASASFCGAFGIDPATVEGRLIFTLGGGEWKSPRLESLLRTTASGGAVVDAYELDLASRDRGIRRLVINAQKLVYDPDDHVRLVVSISDVTESRASDQQRDKLVREKAILLQELQHRVANSLQIIASVLMQSARMTQSEESRGHLNDAHHRVMSVAAVQRQLATTTLSEVELKPYLLQLCDSIGASMIHDHRQIAIELDIDDDKVPAGTSVSLGLIVTELVINALKHAFPQHRRGTITVKYHRTKDRWSLFVDDDGVGIPEGVYAAKAGLGTTIVHALATQLESNVEVVALDPGTSIRIKHLLLHAVGANDRGGVAAA